MYIEEKRKKFINYTFCRQNIFCFMRAIYLDKKIENIPS